MQGVMLKCQKWDRKEEIQEMKKLLKIIARLISTVLLFGLLLGANGSETVTYPPVYAHGAGT
jgi:hypothetical protein